MTDERRPPRWQWLVDFPTTNGQIVWGMWLFGFVVLVPLTLMSIGLKDRISETVIGLLMGGTLGMSGVSTWQKIQKWKEMPESGAEEPSANDPVPPPVEPNVVAPLRRDEPTTFARFSSSEPSD